LNLTCSLLQFYLHESDIGQRRDVVSCARLAELNAYVPVNVHSGTLTPEKLAPFKVLGRPLNLVNIVGRSILSSSPFNTL